MNAATLFGVGPYVAAGAAGVGLGVRFWAEGRRGSAARAAAPAVQAWHLLGVAPIGRWAMLLLLIGHGVLLAAPAAVIRWGGGARGPYVIECGGFLLGLTALTGVVGGLRRHLRDPGGAPAGEIADAVFLSSLSLALVSGLWAAARYRWGSLWAAATVAPYAQSLARGTPVPSLLATVPVLARLHIAAAFAAVATLPPSRLGSALARVAWRIVDAVGVAAQSAARGPVGRLRPQQLFALLWPEEDLADLARQARVTTRRSGSARRRAGAGRPPATAPGRIDVPPIVPALSPLAAANADRDAAGARVSAKGGG